MPTKTLTEALAEGYTHFCMGTLHEESFDIYELTEENLRERIGISQDDSNLSDNPLYGLKPYLCEKEPIVGSLTNEDLSEMICDYVEIKYQAIAGSVMQFMQNKLQDSEAIKQAAEIINKELGEYKTYGDTDILVTLD